MSKKTISSEFSTPNDRLAAYFSGELNEISEKEKDLHNRLLSIWTILTNSENPTTTTEAIKMHIDAHGGAEMMSLSTAYRDLKRATRLFGDLGQTSLQARWLVLHEFAMAVFKKSVNDKDWKEANRALKNLIDITINLKGDDLIDEKPAKYILQIYVDGKETPREINLDNAAGITDIDYQDLKSTIDNAEIKEVEIRKMLEQKDASKET
jgi:hypothetical protein